MVYYIDTSIWIDFLEDRHGHKNEPLGEFALKLFIQIKVKKYNLVLSDILIKELGSFYSIEEINGMMMPFKNQIVKVYANKKQIFEAKTISKQRKLPIGDVLHAILARDNRLILVTRDKHFRDLEDITKCYKPEELFNSF